MLTCIERSLICFMVTKSQCLFTAGERLACLMFVFMLIFCVLLNWVLRYKKHLQRSTETCALAVLCSHIPLWLLALPSSVSSCSLKSDYCLFFTCRMGRLCSICSCNSRILQCCSALLLLLSASVQQSEM